MRKKQWAEIVSGPRKRLPLPTESRTYCGGTSHAARDLGSSAAPEITSAGWRKFRGGHYFVREIAICKVSVLVNTGASTAWSAGFHAAGTTSARASPASPTAVHSTRDRSDRGLRLRLHKAVGRFRPAALPSVRRDMHCRPAQSHGFSFETGPASRNDRDPHDPCGAPKRNREFSRCGESQATPVRGGTRERGRERIVSRQIDLGTSAVKVSFLLDER